MTDNAFQEEHYDKGFDLKVWKKVLQYTKPHRRHFISLAVVILVVSIVDAILPLFTLHIIDDYVVPKNTQGLWQFAWVYIAVLIIQSITIWYFIVLAGKIEVAITYDIRQDGFKKLQQLSFSYFDRTQVGWLMARMTSDCERLGSMIAWGLVDLGWSITLIIGICAIMLYLNWQLALIVLSVVPVLVWISHKFQRLILKSYREVRKTNSRITGAFNEGIMAVNTTKILAREKDNLKEFSGLTHTMLRSSFQAAVQSSLYLPIVQIIGILGCGLAIWFGGSGVITKTITYGVLVAFITYTRHFFDPIQQMARIFAELQNAQASAERIFGMIETEPEIKDSPQVIASTKPWSTVQGEVQFADVDFSYRDGPKILEQFNLHVKAGETIALVGETGSGKSTIINLACRFYEPTAGKILVDSNDYKQMPIKWLQSHLGIVLQSPHLFSGAISENIRYGRLEANDDEIEQAARLVNAHDFIIKMEKGYQSEVGEGGNLLSTGQKQLISFARAILANPSIFIMDEATAHVDTETEQNVQNAIQKILKGRTCFVIAHRLSTIRSADRILVLDHGKIIEEGNHMQLIAKQGRYYRLYTNQFAEENIACSWQ